MRGGGGGSRSVCPKKTLTKFFFFFSPQLILQKSKGQFQRNLSFLRFERGPNIFQGGPTFSRGGGGSNCLFPIETHITCDFPGGGVLGAQRLSGRALDSRPKGRGFEPHPRHCVVSLSKNINPSLVLVQPRKIRPFITERLLMGHKESNQTNKQRGGVRTPCPPLWIRTCCFSGSDFGIPCIL